MKEFAKYDVFDYLTIEVRMVRHVLDRLVEEYFQLSNAERCNAVHTAFDRVKHHLIHQEKLMRAIVLDAGLKRAYSKFQFYQDRIMDLMSDMVFEHPDGQSFYKDLLMLRELVSKLARLEQRRLFAKLKEEMSDEARAEAEAIMGTF